MLCWYHHPVSAGDQLPSCYTIGQPWNSLDRVDGFTDEAVEEPESLLFRKWIIDFAQLVTFRTTSGRLRCEATTVGTLRALEIWGGIFSGWIKRSRNFACRIQVFAFSQVWFPDSPHCSIGHDFLKHVLHRVTIQITYPQYCWWNLTTTFVSDLQQASEEASCTLLASSMSVEAWPVGGSAVIKRGGGRRVRLWVVDTWPITVGGPPADWSKMKVSVMPSMTNFNLYLGMLLIYSWHEHL